MYQDRKRGAQHNNTTAFVHHFETAKQDFSASATFPTCVRAVFEHQKQEQEKKFNGPQSLLTF